MLSLHWANCMKKTSANLKLSLNEGCACQGAGEHSPVLQPDEDRKKARQSLGGPQTYLKAVTQALRRATSVMNRSRMTTGSFVMTGTLILPLSHLDTITVIFCDPMAAFSTAPVSSA